MNAQTSKVLAAAALIIATGMGLVETTRSTASADPLLVNGGAGAYAAARIEAVFAIAAELPDAEQFEIANPEKGDKLPVGCAGPLEADFAAECLDMAYEVEAEPSLVVETRLGSTSILTRMDSFTVAAEY
jgi:hypothetical protein